MSDLAEKDAIRELMAEYCFRLDNDRFAEPARQLRKRHEDQRKPRNAETRDRLEQETTPSIVDLLKPKQQPADQR